MTDYDELSYLRQLANNQKAKLEAYVLFHAAINATALLLFEGKLTPIDTEKNLYKSMHLLNTTLNNIDHA